MNDLNKTDSASFDEIFDFLAEKQAFSNYVIPPVLVAGATIASAIFGGISAINSFKRINNLKLINKKLTEIINLQYAILKAIKDLGVQFKIDLERAFIKDIELELRAYQLSFENLIDILIEKDGRLVFPVSTINYQSRLENLIWKSQDLSNKLSGYGPVTHYAFFASISFIDVMFKIANLDYEYRVSYFNQKKVKIQEFQRHFEDKSKQLNTKLTKLQETGEIDGSKIVYRGPTVYYPMVEMRGNIIEGYECRGWIPAEQRVPAFISAQKFERIPAVKKYLNNAKKYHETIEIKDIMDNQVLSIFPIILKETSALISTYSNS